MSTILNMRARQSDFILKLCTIYLLIASSHSQLAPEFRKRVSDSDLISLKLADGLHKLDTASQGADIISHYSDDYRVNEAGDLLSLQEIGSALGSLLPGLGDLGNLGGFGDSSSGEGGSFDPSSLLGGSQSASDNNPLSSLLPTFVPSPSSQSASGAPNNHLLNFHFNFPPGGPQLPQLGSILPQGPTRLPPPSNLRSNYGATPRPVTVHIHNDGTKRDISRELLSVLTPRERDLLFQNVAVSEILHRGGGEARPDPNDPAWRINSPQDRYAQTNTRQAQPESFGLDRYQNEAPHFQRSAPRSNYRSSESESEDEYNTNQRPTQGTNELGIRVSSDFESLQPFVPRTDDLFFGNRKTPQIEEIPGRVYEVREEKEERKETEDSRRSQFEIRSEENPTKSEGQILTRAKEESEKESSPESKSDERIPVSYRDKIVTRGNRRRRPEVSLDDKRESSFTRDLPNFGFNLNLPKDDVLSLLRNRSSGTLQDYEAPIISRRDRTQSRNRQYSRSSEEGGALKHKSIDNESDLFERTRNVYNRNLDKDDSRVGIRKLKVFTPDSPRPGQETLESLRDIYHSGKSSSHIRESSESGSEDDGYLNLRWNPGYVDEFFDTSLVQTIRDKSSIAFISTQDVDVSDDLVSKLGGNYVYDGKDDAQLPQFDINEDTSDPPSDKDKFLHRFDIEDKEFFDPNSLLSPEVSALHDADNLHSSVDAIDPRIPRTDDLHFGSGTFNQPNLKTEFLTSDIEEEERAIASGRIPPRSERPKVNQELRSERPKEEVVVERRERTKPKERRVSSPISRPTSRRRSRLNKARPNDLERLSEAIDAYAAISSTSGESLASESMAAIEAAAKALKITLTPATKRLLERQFSQMVRLNSKPTLKHDDEFGQIEISSESSKERPKLSPEEEIKKILNDLSKVSQNEDGGALLSYRPILRLRKLLNQYYPTLQAQIDQQKRVAALKKYRRQQFLKQLAHQAQVTQQDFFDIANLNQKNLRARQEKLLVAQRRRIPNNLVKLPSIYSQLDLRTDKSTGKLYGLSESGETIQIQNSGWSSAHKGQGSLEEDVTYIVRRPTGVRPAVLESGPLSGQDLLVVNPIQGPINGDRIPTIGDEVSRIISESGGFGGADEYERLPILEKEHDETTDLLGILGPEFSNRLLPSRKTFNTDLIDASQTEDYSQSGRFPEVQSSNPIIDLSKILGRATQNESPINSTEFFNQFKRITDRARKALNVPSPIQNNEFHVESSEISHSVENTLPERAESLPPLQVLGPSPVTNLEILHGVLPPSSQVAKVADFSIVLNTPDVLPPASGEGISSRVPNPPAYRVNPPSLHIGPPGLNLAPPAPLSSPSARISPPSFAGNISPPSASQPSGPIHVPTAFVASHSQLSQSVVSPPSSLSPSPNFNIFPPAGNTLPILPRHGGGFALPHLSKPRGNSRGRNVISQPAPNFLPNPSSIAPAPPPARLNFQSPRNEDPFNPSNWQWGGQPGDNLRQFQRPVFDQFNIPDSVEQPLISSFPFSNEQKSDFGWDYFGNPDVGSQPRYGAHIGDSVVSPFQNRLAAADSFSHFSAQVLPPTSDFSRVSSGNLSPWTINNWDTEFKKKAVR